MWITAGPPTTRILPFSALIVRISSAILEISSFFGFSADTSLAMKLKISVCRDRSRGTTRTPLWPTTRSMPGRASGNATHQAFLARRSIAIAQSISCFSTGTHSRSSRTYVGRLLVE